MGRNNALTLPLLEYLSHRAGCAYVSDLKYIDSWQRARLARVLEEIPSLQVDMTSNWNRRYRENMERLKSGDLFQVAQVVKGLMLRDVDRGLSTGERKMLHSAKQILISEIVMCQSSSYEDVEERINQALA